MLDNRVVSDLQTPTRSDPELSVRSEPPWYGPGTTVAVVGLGKIGLPLAAQFASRGMSVVGCDSNAEVVATVDRGQAHVVEEAGLAERVDGATAEGLLRATVDTTAAVRDADVVVVIVPVVVDEVGTIDFRSLDAATDAVGRGLRPGALVVYETTLPVGTTRGRLAKRLAAASGLIAGPDFYLAFSPERVSSGRIFRDLRRYPKIVGGVDAASGAAAVAFYRSALEFDDDLAEPRVRDVGSAESAELTKLIETTYRDVNIALANQFARFADAWGLDVVAAIDAANTQPYSHIHRPGVGVGGHCIPVYPYFLLNDHAAGDVLTLAREARRANDAMAGYAIELLRAVLDSLAGRHVLILGFAYRENVREDFLSSARKLIDAITTEGGRAFVHDPYYSGDELRRHGATPYDLLDPAPVDAAVLQANHRAYADLDFRSLPGCRVVLDGRNAIERARVESAGLTYLAVGRANG
jgi:nucleotide sugar dehydrogenase